MAKPIKEKRAKAHPGVLLRARREKARYLEWLFRVRNILRDVFTTDEAVAEWLCKPKTLLDMMTQMEALETARGAAAVENLARATVPGVPLRSTATAHKSKTLSPAQLGRLAVKLRGASPAQAKKIKKEMVAGFYGCVSALPEKTALQKGDRPKELINAVSRSAS